MLNGLFRFSRNRDIQAFPYCRTTHFVKGTDHILKDVRTYRFMRILAILHM